MTRKGQMPFNSPGAIYRFSWLLSTPCHFKSLMLSLSYRGPVGSFEESLVGVYCWYHFKTNLLPSTYIRLQLPGSQPCWAQSFQDVSGLSLSAALKTLNRSGYLVSSTLQIHLEPNPSHHLYAVTLVQGTATFYLNYCNGYLWLPASTLAPLGFIFGTAVRVTLLEYKSDNAPFLL